MIDLEVFLRLLTSERGSFLAPSAVEGAREGSAAAEPGALRQVAAAAEQATISQAR